MKHLQKLTTKKLLKPQNIRERPLKIVNVSFCLYIITYNFFINKSMIIYIKDIGRFFVLSTSHIYCFDPCSLSNPLLLSPLRIVYEET